MNTLALFIHSQINDDNTLENELSTIEKDAWTDLKTLLTHTPKEVAQKIQSRPSPAPWPVASPA